MTVARSDAQVDMQALKIGLKTAWMSGNYGVFAERLVPGAMLFLQQVRVQPGERLLDVGCGAGQITIPAARAGAQAVGVDIAANLIADARRRALDAGVEVTFQEGDAEKLPFADASFDVVVSLYGAIFAPRPELVAAELLRVCRPGGRVVMGNWPPDSFAGELSRTTARYLPPPAVPSPLLWGQEEVVRERFGDRVRDLRLSRLPHPFEFPFAPREAVEFWRMHYGPANRAFAALDEEKQQALRDDLVALWERHNQARDGTTRFSTPLLVVEATRA